MKALAPPGIGNLIVVLDKVDEGVVRFSIGRLLNIHASHMTYELFSVCILGGMEYLTRSRDEAEAGHEP
jgi:hypothetical protein